MRLIQFTPETIPADYPSGYKDVNFYADLGLYIGHYSGALPVDDYVGVWPIPKPETDFRVTKLAFRQRFTFAERVALETAATSDANVRVMLKDQEAATFIDLSRQDTIDGVNALASAGLITAQRASEILTNPIQPLERP